MFRVLCLFWFTTTRQVFSPTNKFGHFLCRLDSLGVTNTNSRASIIDRAITNWGFFSSCYLPYDAFLIHLQTMNRSPHVTLVTHLYDLAAGFNRYFVCMQLIDNWSILLIDGAQTKHTRARERVRTCTCQLLFVVRTTYISPRSFLGLFANPINFYLCTFGACLFLE